MKATIDRKQLLAAVRAARDVTDKRPSIPILASVLLDVGTESVRVAATDLETSYQETLPADVSVAGRITVPADALLGALKGLKGLGMVTLESAEDSYLTLEGIKLAGTDASEYPMLPDSIRRASDVELDSATLGHALESVSYAASSDETRYAVMSVLLEPAAEAFRLVAVDGHRLALLDVECGPVCLPKPVVLPIGWVRAAERALKRDAKARGGRCALRVEEGRVELAAGAVRLGGRLVDGEFPNYRQVIPQPAATGATVDRDELEAALERVKPIALRLERYGMRAFVEVEALELGLKLHASNPDKGEADASCAAECSGFPAAGFNALYLLDALASLAPGRVAIRLADGFSPARIQAEDGTGPLAVVMPMKL